MQRMVDAQECSWDDVAATVVHHPAFSAPLRAAVAGLAHPAPVAVTGDPFKGLPQW